MRKLNHLNSNRKLVCGFEFSVYVLTFILIHQYTIIINLSESDQEFAVVLDLYSKINPST